MKRLGFPVALVFLSLVFVVFFTTVTAVTLASYAKTEKINPVLLKDQVGGTIEMVIR